MPTPDPAVFAALEAALAAQPDSIALRLHLAALHEDAAQWPQALGHYAEVLSREPAHREALRRAAEAALRVGDTVRAVGYGRLLDALGEPEQAEREDAPPDEPPPLLRVDKQTGAGDRSAPPRVPLRLSDGDDVSGGWNTEKPLLTLADVAGMETVKRRLNVAFLGPLKNPDMRRLYGKSLRGGLLLYGPPGCGKTYIARATAGELGAHFIAVGLSDVLDMYLGQSERNLHEIWETARRNRPCVLFFDEIDALGRKRSLQRESAGRDVVNQLLAEMDSVNADNEGVFVLAATNHPWDVDAALRRPGRLDRTLLVLPPDAAAREAILRAGMQGRPLEKNMDLAWVAARTEDYSGADMAHLCEAAAETAMEASLAAGTVRPIMQADLKRALKEVRPSVRPWFDTARNYVLFANEGGLYDDLQSYLRERRLL